MFVCGHSPYTQPLSLSNNGWCNSAVYSVALLLLVALPISAQNDTQELRPRERRYVFQSDNNYPPFEYVENGEITGFNIDLIRAIARLMDLTIDLESDEWRHTRDALEDGRVDGLTGLFYSEERSRFAEFSIPHSTVTHALFVRNDTFIHTLEDAWDKQIIVQEADIMHDYLLEHDFPGEIVTTASPAEALRLLSLGNGDAALLQRPQGLFLINKYKLTNLKHIQTDIAPQHYCFATTKNNKWLADQLSDGLRILRITGEFGAIRQQWLAVYDETDYTLYLRFLREFVLGAALLFFLVMVWVYLLRRQVRRRTKALLESEEKYRTLYEGSSDAIFILDMNELIDCNHRACNLLGASLAEIQTGLHGRFSAPEQPDGSNSVEAAKQHIRKAMQGEAQLFHWWHQHKDGTIIDAEVSLRAIRVLGRPLCMATVRDISERRQAEENIRQERDLVRAIMDTSPVAIIMVDNTGTLVFANHQAKHMLGHALEEMRTKGFSHAAQWLTTSDGTPLAEEQNPLSMVLNTRQMVLGIQRTLALPDSTYKHLSISGAPLFGEHTNLRGAVMVIEDITERIVFEREREQRWQRIREQQTVIVDIARHEALQQNNLNETARFIVTQAANVLKTDLVTIWQLSERQQRLRCLTLFNRQTGEWAPSEDLPVYQAPNYLAALAEGRHIDAHDVLNDPRTRELRDMYLLPNTIGALLDAPIRVAGKLVGVLSHAHVGHTRKWRSDEIQFAAELADQTALAFTAHERAQAEKARHALEIKMLHTQKLESLGILAGGVAHDFNNLLMAIIGNAELALMDTGPATPAHNAAKEIELVAQRAAELCRQMLAYSGKGKFVVKPININTILTEIGHMLEVSIAKRAVLRYDLAQHLPAVEADISQIRQVLMNLVLNASEALEDKEGAVTITTRAIQCDRDYLDKVNFEEDLATGLYVRVEVADNGVGMDAATREKIFDPFFSTKFTGRGLGLAAVLGIVRGHNGAIKVYSEPGKGANFTLLLPATEKAAAADTLHATPDNTWRGKGVLLLVDDEQSLLKVGKRMLQRLGFDVLTASTGHQAVDLFREHERDIRCVLLDLTMPGMNGVECFEELRMIRPDIKVLLSSGFNEQDATQQFVDKGLAGFVRKPYRLAALTSKLRDILD